MLYNSDWENCFEELISWYPRFYRDVREMVAILKAHGSLGDGMQEGIEKVLANAFVDTADPETIEKLEKFLGISLHKERDIEERRRLVKAYLIGFGSMTADKLRDMIQGYTGAQVRIEFKPDCDEEHNSWLLIDYERGDVETLYVDDILKLLSKKIPAHIKWVAKLWYYRYPVGIGRKRTYWKADYVLCGTKPDWSKLGDFHTTSSVTETGAAATGFGVNYLACGTTVAGLGGL